MKEKSTASSYATQDYIRQDERHIIHRENTITQPVQNEQYS